MTVTVTATAEPSTGPQDAPRVRLDVTSTSETSTTVTRLDPDGRTVPVRTFDGNPLTLSSGTGLLYDYEAPLGVSVSYSSIQSPATVSAPVTLSSAQVWLIHPGIPSLSRPVRVMNMAERVQATARAVHWPLGRRTPVVQTDGARKAPVYVLTIRTSTEPDRADLETLLSDAGVLLLNVPASKGWGVGSEYVSVGDVTEARTETYGTWPVRDWSLPCVVVDRPVGGSQAERTFVDVLADNATFADLMTRYPTFLDLLAGP